MNKSSTIEDFIKTHNLDGTKGISIVTTKDLSELKSQGYTVEKLLQQLCDQNKILLHGSRTNITENYLRANPRGNIYGANLSAIALMKAILSNRELTGNGLEYPYFINENPLEVEINGLNEQTIGENGFVYLLNHTEEFQNYPTGSWQYILKKEYVPITAKIEVLRDDFKYPIYDITNNRRIQ
ncbi:MAG: hypothetical protein ACP5N1_02330 [Candidatus Woesearchaeota archaeon]